MKTQSADRFFRLCAAAGAASAAVAVALGAFGAHGLRHVISPEMLTVFETGVRYEMYHAIGMIAAGMAGSFSPTGRRWLLLAGSAFGLGTILFSGSLYALAFSDRGWIGAITPVGGLLFLAGWVVLAAGFASTEEG